MIATPSSENTFGTLTGLTVIIQGEGTISLHSNGVLLRVGDGQTLVVRDVTLKGRDNNTNSVVWIDIGGTFRMEGRAAVSNNIRTSEGSGGVANNGTFSMQDNTSVSGNTGRGSYGGGVGTSNGTFIMRDNATVSGNTSQGYDGGGVNVGSGTFTMQDSATVSGNTSQGYGDGGGVYVGGGTFSMTGNATVSGNTSDGNGGGVFVEVRGTFTKRGGTIYGSNETDANLRNTAHQGHAIYDARNNGRWRGSTAGPTMNPEAFGFWLND